MPPRLHRVLPVPDRQGRRAEHGDGSLARAAVKRPNGLHRGPAEVDTPHRCGEEGALRTREVCSERRRGWLRSESVSGLPGDSLHTLLLFVRLWEENKRLNNIYVARLSRGNYSSHIMCQVLHVQQN